MVLKYALAPNRSFWKFYQIVRRLYNDNYIKEVSSSESSISFWTLTKKGFQYLNDGSLGLTQARYQPQALFHDYWALVFQFGDFIFGIPSSVEIISEQEFTAREISDLPDWVPKTKTHIPDGLTRLKKDDSFEVVAFEIELSAKSDSRYEEMIHYLDQTEEINWVLWLCENESIIKKITRQITAVRRLRPMMHHFILKEDVQKHGWSAPFLWGKLTGKTVYDLLGQGLSQEAVKTTLESHQFQSMNIYLESKKSPHKANYLGTSLDPLNILTPKGPGI